MIRMILVFSLLLYVSPTVHAEGKSEVPAELTKMLEQFSEAVSSGNKKKASELSSFPLKNTVYGAKPTKSQKEFESSFKASMRGFCYNSKMPEKDQEGKDWMLDCNGNVFYFGMRAGKWKYLGYENINE